MQTAFQQYTLSAKLLKEAVKDPFGAFKSEGRLLYATEHNKFRIRVKNTQSGDFMTFIYYGTAADCKNGITELSEESLLSAFHYALSEADSGRMSFIDFCYAWGCDPETKYARKEHRKCIIMLDKIENDLLIGSDQQSLLLKKLCEPVSA